MEEETKFQLFDSPGTNEPLGGNAEGLSVSLDGLSCRS
jgi:hypothetical protein